VRQTNDCSRNAVCADRHLAHLLWCVVCGVLDDGYSIILPLLQL
jgi:hypothetical protein